jgi:hypothetical protein
VHTHLVIANRVQGPDGRWTALTAGTWTGIGWPRTPSTGPATSASLSDARVEWTAADRYGNRELQGVPEALVRSFSKRTGQIDAELDGWPPTVGSGHPGWSSGPST